MSSRLRTPPKARQAKAVSWMIEKESGKLLDNEFHSLWEVSNRSLGQPRYRNTVTDSAHDAKPPLCLSGLLADDMGLGKTLTTLALIATSLDVTPLSKVHSSQSERPRMALIIARLSVFSTRREQIKRHFNPASLKLFGHHGPRRLVANADLAKYHIILTVHDTVT